jgi:tetratricopeptide (TPR) repeat protein
VLGQATNNLGEVAPLLAALLSIPTGDRYPPLNLSAQKQKEKTLRALLTQVEGLAERQPVLMVWEDVQWSDPTSRELLDLIVDRVPSLPILAIVTYRPEFVSSWVGRSHVTLLTLNRLPPRRCGEMIAHVTGGKALPADVFNQIIDRTDGVPLFVEELTKAVIESGALADDGARSTVAGPLPSLAIPTSLNASLLARLDRLAPARDVAQIASALGRQFSHELISEVAAIPQQKLDDALAQLVSAELIFQRGTPPDAEYTFKHVLVQDAAYGTLLHTRRQQLHARIAATLEDHFPETVAVQPALLARHCAEAGLAEKAVSYWLKAGQHALARSASTEAIAQLQKGLRMLADLPDGSHRQQQELELQIALRSVLAVEKGRSAPEVGEAIARARELAEQIDRAEYLVPLLYGQWAFHSGRSEHKLALSLAEQIEKIGEARGDVAAQLRGRHVNGLTRCYLGEFTTARTLLDQCHGLGDPAHRAIGGAVSHDHYAVMLVCLAVTLAYLGFIDQARSRMNEALSEARHLREAQAQTLAGVLLYATRLESITRSAGLQLRAEELLALSTEHGFRYHLGWATVARGRWLTAIGKAQDGLTLLTQGLAAVGATGNVVGTPDALIGIAEAYTSLGQPVEGLNCLSEAGRIIDITDERLGEAELHRVRGDLLKATGDRGAAERSYRQALAAAERQGAKLFELRVATSLGRHWRDEGKRIQARDLLAPVYGWFTEGFDTPILEEAKALLDRLV